MSISYISLMNTVSNLAERDQYLGRPIIMVTDEGHIITKKPLLAPFVVKGTKMWRKLGGLFWLATQNLADFPAAAQTMLNMFELSSRIGELDYHVPSTEKYAANRYVWNAKGEDILNKVQRAREAMASQAGG